jgi:hypothetical protein
MLEKTQPSLEMYPYSRTGIIDQKNKSNTRKTLPVPQYLSATRIQSEYLSLQIDRVDRPTISRLKSVYIAIPKSNGVDLPTTDIGSVIKKLTNTGY